MNRIWKWIPLLILAAGLSGCVSPRVIRLSHHPYEARDSDCDIPVYYGDETVHHTYVEVCLFSFAAQGTYTDGGPNGPQIPGRAAKAVVDSCKSRACRAGCDAILVEDADVDGADLNPAGLKQERTVLIKGIKFVDPPADPKKEDPEDLLYLHQK